MRASNGGYGSVLLSLSQGVPVLDAGIQERKYDVNARGTTSASASICAASAPSRPTSGAQPDDY